MSSQSSFGAVLPLLPAPLQAPLSRLKPAEQNEITEIRLRIGRAMHVTRGGAERVVTAEGALAAEPASGVPVTRQLLDQTLQNLCAHSLHACQHAIRQGYVTAAGGCRAGLCGTAVMQGGTVETVRALSGINLRIASARTGCAEPIFRMCRDLPGGILICGAPASGKTTVLRDLARLFGAAKRVSVMDERGEIAAVQNGVPQFDLGAQTDVFDGYPKAEGIAVAVRVMSPQILICDELGGAAETDALLHSLHTGVRLIASAHAESIPALRRRPQIRRLIEAGAFSHAILLGSGAQCGQVLAAEALAPVCV